MCFHLQTSLGQNKIHPVQYVESNFHPQGGRGKPVKQLSGDSSPKPFFLVTAGRGGGLTLDCVSAFAYRFGSFFSCDIELLCSQFFFQSVAPVASACLVSEPVSSIRYRKTFGLF